MSKKKKSAKVVNKGISVNKHIQELHTAYDYLEVIAMQTAERTLRETFGFGDVRLERFRKQYQLYFSEEAAKFAEAVKRNMRRQGI